MKSVEEFEYTYIIKNSKFISRIYRVNNQDEIKTYLEKAKKDYPDATHYCYGYIIDNIRKESDDGEPSGTAGIPILQVLEKNNINKVLCIVIRYFGKIKLGAGGLVRAYTKSVTECIKDHIITLIEAYKIKLTFPYQETKNIDYLLQNTKIESKKFDELITYQIIVSKDLLQILKSKNYQIEIIDKTYIKE